MAYNCYRHQPSNPPGMLYHIFNPLWMIFRQWDEWLIQDESNNLLYWTIYRPKVDANVKHLYRASPENGERIATIQCISESVWLIKRDSEETGWLFQTPCFDYGDVKYGWSGSSRLTSTAGRVIAQFKTGSWRYTKVGDLKLVEMNEDMRVVVLATMMAMDWSIRIQAARLAFYSGRYEEEQKRIHEDRNKNGLHGQKGGSKL